MHQEHNDDHDSHDDDWPVMEQPQPVNVQSVAGPEPHVESDNVDYERSNQYINSCTEETPAEDEHVFEEHTENVVSSRNTHEDTSGSASLHDNDLYHEDQAFEHNEAILNL
ncbi:hypothetical protein HanPI659440_Chr04g0144611 [Helianthus annuus]|nr:hypothetical protein HanPI659440_Chr04g0144611 [Helianthus annuus]